MKIASTLLIGALVAMSGACKKKDKGSTETTDPGAGTPKPNEGSNATKPPEPEKEKPLEGEALAKKYLSCVEMVNGSKFDDFQKDCVASDITVHMADGPDAKGPEEMKKFFSAMKTGFPDWKLSPQLVVVNGRNIMAVNLETGTNTADWKSPDGKDMKKTDKKVGYFMFHKLAINEENRATEEWAFVDPMTMMGQLGVLPKEAGPTRPVAEQGWEGAPIILVTADNDQEKANIELWKKLDTAMNDHKIPDMVGAFADDAVESDQADPQDHKGKKEMEASIKMFLTAFPDIKATDDNVYAAGDYVIGIGSATGTNKGPMGPIKATGKQVTLHYAEIGKIKDGKIVQVWRFRNGMAMAAQLGLIPADMGGAPAGDKGAAPDMKK